MSGLLKPYANRGDLAVNLLAANRVYLKNELIVEEDTGFFKFGDGVSTYSQLPYASSGGGGFGGNLDGGSPITTGSGSVDGGTP